TRRVGALERRQVEHRDRQPDALLLGGGLDRALAELRRALLHSNAVNMRQSATHSARLARDCGRDAIVTALTASGVRLLPVFSGEKLGVLGVHTLPARRYAQSQGFFSGGNKMFGTFARRGRGRLAVFGAVLLGLISPAPGRADPLVGQWH